jgi:hypothetical protein
MAVRPLYLCDWRGTFIPVSRNSGEGDALTAEAKMSIYK